MALIDANIKQLPHARCALGVCFAGAAASALLFAFESYGLARALTNVWEACGGAASVVPALLAEQALWLALFVVAYLARNAVVYARGRYLDKFAQKTCSYLRESCVCSLYDAGPNLVQQQGSGTITSTLVEGINQVRTYVSLILPKTADLMVIPAVLALVLLLFDAISGVISLCILPCIIFFMRLLGSYAKENAAKQHGEFERLTNHFSDTLKGMSTLHYFGRSKQRAGSIFKASERLREATIKTLKTATLSSLVLDLFRVFALAAVAIMLGFRLMAGTVSLLPALMVLIVVPELFATVRRYSADFHASLDGRNQLQSILNIMHYKQATAERATCDEASCITAAVPKQPQTPDELRSVEFSHVSMDYHTQGETYRALHDVSFVLHGPLRVGIVGQSGSGKSTLASVIAGFSHPSTGSILVNGVPSLLESVAWRSRLSYIPQSPYLFAGTLCENIAFYCPQASEEAVLEAAEKAGLSELLERLPEGLNTLVGEGGRALSGGQAQRVALARAFLDKRRSVLIFDEPTAHLDIETEYELKKQMLPLMQDKLVFFATHRLHWLRNMDYILMLENGCVVEQGTLNDLLAKNGAFARFVEHMQGGGAHDETA